MSAWVAPSSVYAELKNAHWADCFSIRGFDAWAVMLVRTGGGDAAARNMVSSFGGICWAGFALRHGIVGGGVAWLAD